MAEALSGAGSKKDDLSDDLMADESEGMEFDVVEEAVPPVKAASSARDPAVRRKIEDRLERIRLREELGIYDEHDLEDL